jgi:hypothetical protein
VVQSYAYSPFGETTPANQTVANPFQFTGRENEENGLGLYYYRNRATRGRTKGVQMNSV